MQAYGLHVEDVNEGDGEVGAGLWRAGSGMSLADRICLAVARRLGATALTADAQWGNESPIVQIGS